MRPTLLLVLLLAAATQADGAEPDDTEACAPGDLLVRVLASDRRFARTATLRAPGGSLSTLASPVPGLVCVPPDRWRAGSRVAVGEPGRVARMAGDRTGLPRLLVSAPPALIWKVTDPACQDVQTMGPSVGDPPVYAPEAPVALLRVVLRDETGMPGQKVIVSASADGGALVTRRVADDAGVVELVVPEGPLRLVAEGGRSCPAELTFSRVPAGVTEVHLGLRSLPSPFR